MIETHPGGGQYDCITLIDEDRNSNLSTIDLNRAGSIWVHRRDHSFWTWRHCWQELVTADDLLPQLNRLCAEAGLPPVGLPPSDRLPRSTRSVIAYRMIAAFLAHQVFSRARWQCLNGYLDSSGMSGGVRDQFFNKFPAARESMTNSATLFEEDGQAAYRFWFLVKDDEPRLAIEPGQGTAWAPMGARATCSPGTSGRTGSGPLYGRRPGISCRETGDESSIAAADSLSRQETADRSAAVAVALVVVSEGAKASGRVTQPLSGRLWPTSCGGS